MLRSLDIRDMLIIDRLELELQPGLNVLTGETGAGKSILLDALGFVLGWRGRAELVREGAAQGEVTAVFDLPVDHPAQAVLDEAGYDRGDELILRRVNTRDGRKTAFVNDRRAGGGLLQALSTTLVELHGQHDDSGLLNTRGHRGLLDAFAGLHPRLAATRAAWRARVQARKALDDAIDALEQIAKEEDFLRHAVAELDALAPEAGEEQALDARRRLMRAAERIREDVAKALDAIGGQGAEGQIGDAMRWIEGVAAGVDTDLNIEEPLSALSRALVELGEAQGGLDAQLAALSFDAHELENTEERLFALRALARKHDVLPDDLAGFADTLRTRLEALDQGGAEKEELAAALAQADAAYQSAAAALSAGRKSGAARLDKAIAAELAPLKMERAVFTTQLGNADPGPDGVDEVVFTASTNPGAPSGQLNKIASGGEMSRFLLALKVCLTNTDGGTTLIFDEIDRGVGGATADAVGRRLADLAAGGQVLVVTHSPQVAALGHHHLKVSKSVKGGVTLSRVEALSQDARTAEIARMLSGDTVTQEARAAAKALLSA